MACSGDCGVCGASEAGVTSGFWASWGLRPGQVLALVPGSAVVVTGVAPVSSVGWNGRCPSVGALRRAGMAGRPSPNRALERLVLVPEAAGFRTRSAVGGGSAAPPISMALPT